MWVVDTCVLIDLLRRDEAFATLAADALDAKRAEGLTIAPLTYVELSPALGGDIRALYPDLLILNPAHANT